MSIELFRSRAMLVSAASVGLAAGAAPAQPCEPLWSDQFAPIPLNSFVWDLAVFDDGSGEGPTVYAGGFFTEAGQVTVNRIARLDGNTWSPLGDGMDSSVRVLEPCDVCPDRRPSLYAGGEFTLAGGVEVNSIARWDGEAWSPLGGGMTDKVFSGVFVLLVTDELVGPGPALYAGGFFDTAGGLPVNNIARWDGSAWSALGSGLDGSVRALAVFDDGTGPALYAAGNFTLAGEIEVNHIARWDGDTWSAVGGGVDGSGWALAVFDDGSGPALYLGGNFTVAGGIEAVDIAKWDGTTWTPVGAGVADEDFNSWVPDLLVFDDDSGAGSALYAGGTFDTAGEVEAHNIARWDGAVWTALGSGLDSTGRALAGLHGGSPDAVLYAGGFFHTAGEVDAERVAAWSGAQWSAVTRQPAFPEEYAVLYDLDVFDDGLGKAPALYAAGVFGEAGGVQSRSVARFDGVSWSSPDGGVGGQFVTVRAMEVFDDGSGPGLYVGGAFDSAGSDEIETNNIARWDGRQWSPLGGGVAGFGTGGVFGLAASDGGFGGAPALFVGGAFTEVDDISANLVARWDGQAWSALGSGIDPNDSLVLTVLVVDQPSAIGPALYVGGIFQTAGGVSARSIARWDGRSWSALGEGVAGGARALAVYDDGRGPALYVGGTFQTAGGVTAKGIARWNGTAWSSVGGLADGQILDLAVIQAPFDEGPVLYAVGLFSFAGGVSANSIARYNGAFWTSLGAGVGDSVYPIVRAVGGFDDGLGNGTAVFAGGQFTTAGGIPSARFAKWTGCASDELPPFMPCEYEAQTIAGAPIGINDAGVICGFKRHLNIGLAEAFIWTPDSGQEFLDMPPNVRESWANDVNNAGVIAGSVDFDDDDLAFLAMRYEAGTVLSLGTLPGGVASIGRAINEAGWIVGWWSTTPFTNDSVAFIWQGRMVDLGPDLGTLRSAATDINDQGLVTGWMGTSLSFNADAFIWDDGAVTNIGVIPGGTTGRGEAINNMAQVVVTGRLDTGGSPSIFRTFIWQDGQWTDLGVLDGCDTCRGIAINDAGVVVGRCAPAGTSAWRGFIWRDGVMMEFDELLAWDSPVFVNITWAINAMGQIAAGGATGLSLTPVEQPLGDIDGDCRVDMFDFLILLFEWGETDSAADLDGDGLVGINDLLILLANWGQG